MLYSTRLKLCHPSDFCGSPVLLGAGRLDIRKIIMDIRIAAFKDYASAGMIHEILTSKGRHPRLIDTSAHISIAGADQYYYLYVPQNEMDNATKILIEFGYEENIIK